MFEDRIDAGRQLAGALKEYRDRGNTVVVALPRGGVVPGYVIARELNLPLEVAMVKKLGHPTNPEYAIGAVSLTGSVLDSHVGVSQGYIEEAAENVRALLRQRLRLYQGDRPPPELRNKTVIVVDDGVATGRTLIAALELVREEGPKQVIAAVPVGPADTIRSLQRFADRVVCLETHDDFYAIGLYYDNFAQVSDEEVKDLLARARQPNVS